MECLSCGFPLEHCILFYSFVVILIVALIFFMSLLLHWKLELTSAEVLRYGLNSLIVEMCQSGFHGEFCYSSLVDGDRELFGSKEKFGNWPWRTPHAPIIIRAQQNQFSQLAMDLLSYIFESPKLHNSVRKYSDGISLRRTEMARKC